MHNFAALHITLEGFIFWVIMLCLIGWIGAHWWDDYSARRRNK
jgi:hypothetical protein